MSRKKKHPAFVEKMAAAKQAVREAHAENVRRYGSEAAARKMSPMYKALPSTKPIKLALVDGTWYQVYRVHKDPHGYDGDRAFFFGIGSGYDIVRVLVMASSFDDAVEAAENKWPDEFFTKLLTPKQFEKLEAEPGDDWESNPENYRFVEDAGKWGLPQEDIRIAKEADVYAPTAVKIDTRTAMLPDGETVEYA